MKQLTTYLFFLAFSIVTFSCEHVDPTWKEKVDQPELLHSSMKKLTDVIVYDIFSPPVASRNYLYPTVGAYEIMALKDDNYTSLAGQVKDLTAIPQPQQEVCHELSALSAFLDLSKEVIFSVDKIDEKVEEIITAYSETGMPKKVLNYSITYGAEVARHIWTWAKKDNYHETRSYPKFSVTNDPGRWKPTPPAYQAGIEPSWNLIRTAVIDSASQFQPAFPTSYDMKEGSVFYDEVIEVFKAVAEAEEEEKEIASFWDCNPFVMNVSGHVMHATKKITPGGHWINITALACKKDSASFMESIHAYAAVSIALFDGFISCWDEKYRSNLIRPETIINEYIDEDWVPLLQTPPFPEYTSGHSVISGAAAVALTDIFGDNFSFLDDTEMEFGLPARNFRSFYHASEEAAISRLYGGIHYRPAIDNGVTQGRALGKYVMTRLNFRKS